MKNNKVWVLSIVCDRQIDTPQVFCTHTEAFVAACKEIANMLNSDPTNLAVLKECVEGYEGDFFEEDKNAAYCTRYGQQFDCRISEIDLGEVF